MDDYKKVYYGYQTQARGLLDECALRQRFEKLAKWYGCRLRTCLPEKLTAKCLDLPCGYGNFLYFLRSKGYKDVAGLDLDIEQVKLAKKLNLPAHEGDVFSYLSGEEESFDLISSLDFIEHLSKDEALKFIELCMQSLRPGGTLILRAPCADGPFGAHDMCNDLTHEWGMTSNVLQTILEIHGFEGIEVLDERPQPTNIIDMLRWLVFFPAKGVADLFCIALGVRPPHIWTRSMIAVAYKPDIGSDSETR